MTVLRQAQIDRFRADGYLVVENIVESTVIDQLRETFGQWVEESRRHPGDWGTTTDSRPRFDVEAGHGAGVPRLRRVAAPIEISGVYYDVCTNSAMTDAVADLVGPDVKLHHTKINSKLPGARTEVKWHQDFPFTPHSNDDLVTALLFIDDVTMENGPLEVAPGSHRGPIESIWREQRFTGAVDDDVARRWQEQAVPCTGPAGSVCLMHTRLGHGSAPNRSDRPRTLFICVYSAEDAVPCSRNPVPHRYEGLVVRGRPTGRIRSMAFDIRLPEYPKTTSFFEQQEAGAGRPGN